MKFFCSDRVCFEWLCVNYCFLMFEYDCVHSTVAVCVCVSVCAGVLRRWWGFLGCPPIASWRIRPNKPSAERWSRRGWGEQSGWCCRETLQRWGLTRETWRMCSAVGSAFVNNVKVFWLAVSSQCRERKRRRAVVLRPPVTISRGWRTSSNRPRWRPGWVKSTPVTVYDESKGFPICLLLYSNLPFPVWKW